MYPFALWAKQAVINFCIRVTGQLREVIGENEMLKKCFKWNEFFSPVDALFED